MKKKLTALWGVDAPHFCAGIIVDTGKIVHAAPILRWTVGDPITEFADYCATRGWKLFYISAGVQPKVPRRRKEEEDAHQR